jgi:hypothetical protein
MTTHVPERDDKALPKEAAATTVNPDAAQKIHHPHQRRLVIIGDFTAIIALSVAFIVLVIASLRPPSPIPVVSQTFELPTRPIWINDLPFAPRDGLQPDWAVIPQRRTELQSDQAGMIQPGR